MPYFVGHPGTTTRKEAGKSEFPVVTFVRSTDTSALSVKIFSTIASGGFSIRPKWVNAHTDPERGRGEIDTAICGSRVVIIALADLARGGRKTIRFAEHAALTAVPKKIPIVFVLEPRSTLDLEFIPAAWQAAVRDLTRLTITGDVPDLARIIREIAQRKK